MILGYLGLVALPVIGVLSAIAIPVFLGQQSAARDSAVQSDITNAKIANATIEDAKIATLSASKIIAIIVLLSLGFHLLLFGYMKRRIAAAKRKEEQLHD